MEMDITVLVRLNVIRLREEKGWSQEQLAIQLNKSKGWVSHLEAGKRGIKLDHLGELADAFNISIEQLILPIMDKNPVVKVKETNVFSEMLLQRNKEGKFVKSTLPPKGALRFTVINNQISDIGVSEDGSQFSSCAICFKENFIEDIGIVLKTIELGLLFGEYELDEKQDIMFTSLRLSKSLKDWPIRENESTYICSAESIIDLKEKGYTNSQLAEFFDLPEEAIFKMVNTIYNEYTTRPSDNP